MGAGSRRGRVGDRSRDAISVDNWVTLQENVWELERCQDRVER